MKNLFLYCFALLFLFSCKKSELPIEDETPLDLIAAQKRLVQSDNEFGIKLFKQIHQQEEADKNIFISPLSISMALGMTLNGAAGDTRTAMQTTLEHHGLTQAQINQVYRNLINRFNALDPDVRMDIANSIWYRQDFTVLQDFIQTNQQYFDAETHSLDFDDPNAKDIINQWVEAATNGKIPEIIDEIYPEHVMFLINAIYFNGFWTHAFDPQKTYPGSFQLQNGTYVTAEMMFHDSIPFNYYADNQVEAAEFTYGNGVYSMFILLPAYGSNVETLINNLTLQQWDNWLANLNNNHSLEVYMPKYEIRYEIQLKEVLSLLGMGIAFTDNADFSGISDAHRLMIDQVRHKTYIKVNEEGTEAAAVTSVGVSITSLPPAFYINRPFIVAIREKETGSILFIGKIMNPAEN